MGALVGVGIALYVVVSHPVATIVAIALIAGAQSDSRRVDVYHHRG